MYYKVFLEPSQQPLYIPVDSFRVFIATVSDKCNVLVDKVVEPEDLTKGDLYPVVNCQIINPKTVF